jgi:hypothetical protein
MTFFPLLANLPPVSTTPVVPRPSKFTSGVVDIGGKFANGVVDTSGAPLLATPRICEKFQITLMIFLGAWGKRIHEKTCSKRSSDTVPLK